jgi:multimeric flavodoxin WrbA
MKATVITDKDYQNELFQELYQSVLDYLQDKQFESKTFNIGRNDLNYCMGCFGCWVKKPGECVINDMIADINHSFVSSEAVIYISPVIFGQFSASIKSAIDRWLPNMLPFFATRADGSTMHPPRYTDYPAQVMIGYADDLSPEDAQLFTDIIKKHRNNVGVLIYRGPDTDIAGFLDSIELKRVEGSL